MEELDPVKQSLTKSIKSPGVTPFSSIIARISSGSGRFSHMEPELDQLELLQLELDQLELDQELELQELHELHELHELQEKLDQLENEDPSGRRSSRHPQFNSTNKSEHVGSPLGGGWGCWKE